METKPNKSPIDVIIDRRWVEDMSTNINVDYDLRDDFIQEVYLILLQYDKNKLEEMLWKGENNLKYFVNKIITNQYNSVNSPFYYTYKKIKKEPLIDIIDGDE